MIGVSTRLFASPARRGLARMSSQVRSTAASGSGVYESKRAVDEYLLFHYGSPELLMPYEFGPRSALGFMDRVANLATSRHGRPAGSIPLRALDVGCAVGGLSFALASTVEEVVGLDYSQHFVDAANGMKERGAASFQVLKQGNIFFNSSAKVPNSVDRSRVTFLKGDACNLETSLGTFDIIVASNLLCRLPKPAKFLNEVSSFLRPNGILVLVSPYSWLEEYTAVEDWIGARDPSEPSWSVVKRTLEEALRLEHEEDMPFIIREHERKFQFGVSHASVWRKEGV